MAHPVNRLGPGLAKYRSPLQANTLWAATARGHARRSAVSRLNSILIIALQIKPATRHEDQIRIHPCHLVPGHLLGFARVFGP